MVSYFNLTEEGLLNKSYEDYQDLCLVITKLRARQTLRDIQAYTYSKLKEKEQQRTHRNITKAAYPENFKRKILRLDEIDI